jgi:hypothetical protein
MFANSLTTHFSYPPCTIAMRAVFDFQQDSSCPQNNDTAACVRSRSDRQSFNRRSRPDIALVLARAPYVERSPVRALTATVPIVVTIRGIMLLQPARTSDCRVTLPRQAPERRDFEIDMSAHPRRHPRQPKIRNSHSAHTIR